MQNQCGRRAALIVTRKVEGTASNVAKRRIELVCRAPAGHAGPHLDPDHDERWAEDGREVTMILRDESDDS